jgi:HD-like signal output (HDOD) protein
METIENKVRQLPFTPDSIFKLQRIKNTNDYDTNKILEILEEDHFVVCKILEMANSKLFGFSNHVDTLSKALALYGMNFTISVAFTQIIKNTINLNFDLYNIRNKIFFDLADYSCKLMLLWLEEEDISLKEKLVVPCLIHEIGKSFISSSIEEKDVGIFINELKNNPQNISLIEKKFTSFTSSEVTALILEEWNFDKKAISIIKNIDTPNDKASFILDVIKTIFNINSPFTKESIGLAIKKADEYGLDVEQLKKALRNLVVLIKDDLKNLGS